METLPTSIGPIGTGQSLSCGIYSLSENHFCKMLLLHIHFGIYTVSHKSQVGLPHHGVLE